MLAKANPQDLQLSLTKHTHLPHLGAMDKRIWLPELLYDGLPYFYLTAGFAAIFATLYISDWFWILPHYLLFSAACMHLAYVVFRHRRAVPDADKTEPMAATEATTVEHCHNA